MINLDQLEALALAATSGPWEYRHHDPSPRYEKHLVERGGPLLVADWENEAANATFVAAANPAAVLELVAEMRRLRPLLEEAADALHKNKCEKCGAQALRIGRWDGYRNSGVTMWCDEHEPDSPNLKVSDLNDAPLVRRIRTALAASGAR